MTETPVSRSGLDIPEGSANADTVPETKLIDTGAEDARNPVPVASTGQGGDESAQGDSLTGAATPQAVPAADATDQSASTQPPAENAPVNEPDPGASQADGTTPVSEQPVSDSPDQAGVTQPDGSTVTDTDGQTTDTTGQTEGT